MRNKILLLSITLLTAVNARAEGIHYDRIPADAVGYVHMDFDRVFTSHLVLDQPKGKEIVAQFEAFLGEHADTTVYLTKSGGREGWVVLWHTSDPNIRKRVETSLAKSKSIAITYNQQEIHYSSAPASQLLEMLGPIPTKKSDAPAPGETDKKHEIKFSIGLGLPNDPTGGSSYNGPSYVAFVGQDLIVIAGQLPAITGGLDVIQARTPSLAQQDPEGLRMEAPPGVVALGAGLTEDYFADKAKPADSAKPAKPKAAGQFGADMFGPFKTKARLARFDVGADDKQVYADASLIMKDADTTEQLKNLIVGVKALLSLSQEKVKPLIDPLEIKANDKDVTVRWSWPTDKLGDLLHLVQVQAEVLNSAPAK